MDGHFTQSALVGGVVAAVLGVFADGKSLEDVASPLALRRPGTRAEGAARAGRR